MIKLVQADKIQRVPGKYDGNLLFSGNVIFKHKGTTLKSDSAVFDEANNYFKAFSNVEMINPKYNLTTQNLEYDGNTEYGIARGNVVLKDSEQTLYTDQLDYDQKTNIAYYNNGGTIVSKESTINSIIGTYNVNTKINTFEKRVAISSKDYFIDSENVVHNSKEESVEFFDNTTIQSKENSSQFIKTSKGKYYLKKKEAFLKNRSSVHSEGKSIIADDLYYNQITGEGEGTGDVLLDDPVEKRYIKGEIGKFYKELDSAFVTKNALAVRAFEKDSLYLHADTLMATKRDSASYMRAFRNARFFKSNIQGKADSIVFSEGEGTLKFFKEPILWSDYKQITGDTLIVYIDLKYEQLDSMQVRNNAFTIAQRDSLHPKEFNQLKSKNMSAVFKNDSLEWTQARGNAQSTLYMEDENKTTKQKELLGINRSDCGIIEANFDKGQIDIISCRISQKSKMYPPFEFPEEQRFLPDFRWRGKEKFKRWQDIMLPINQEEKETKITEVEDKIEKKPQELQNGQK